MMRSMQNCPHPHPARRWQSNMGKQVMYQMSKENYEKAERGMSQDLATTSLPHCEMGQDIIKIVNQRIEDHQAYLASKGIAPTPGPWDDPSVKPRPRRGNGPGSSTSAGKSASILQRCPGRHTNTKSERARGTQDRCMWVRTMRPRTSLRRPETPPTITTTWTM